MAAYKQFRVLYQSEDFELSLYQSYICSYLSVLPKGIENDFVAVVRERQTRTEVMNLICTRADLAIDYFEKENFNETHAMELFSMYLHDTPLQQDLYVSDRHLSKLPNELLDELTNFINNIEIDGHRGLFVEKINPSDHLLLLTTGKPEKVYHCWNNSAFAYYAYFLAVKKNSLDARSYLKTICSCNMLYSKPRRMKGEIAPGIPITTKNLSASRTYRDISKYPYSEIRKQIDALFALYSL